MADNPPSSSQSTPRSNLIGASRVFILTPEMLKKLGLAEKVQLIQSKLKPENTVQLVTKVKKSDSPMKPKKLNEKISKKLPEKIKKIENEVKSNESSINDKLINSNKLDDEIKSQKLLDETQNKSIINNKDLNLISENLENEEQSIFKSPVKTLKNQESKISSEDEKEDVERKLTLLFGDSSPQKLENADKSNGENENLKKSLEFFQSPEKKEDDAIKSVEISEKNSQDLPSNSLELPEIQSARKVRSKLKPKIQLRSRKLPTKAEQNKIVDSSKSLSKNDEKSVTINEESTEIIGNDEKIENNLINELTVASFPKFVDKIQENIENEEFSEVILHSEKPKNVENDEENNLNEQTSCLREEFDENAVNFDSRSERIQDNEDFIVESSKIMYNGDNFDELEEQGSSSHANSLKNNETEVADEVFIAEVLKFEDKDDNLDEFKEGTSGSSKSLENCELKCTAEYFGENREVHRAESSKIFDQEATLNEVEERSSCFESLSNEELRRQSSDLNSDFLVEALDNAESEDNSNGFEEFCCPSPRSSLGDEASADFDDKIQGNVGESVFQDKGDNRLNESRKEPQENSEVITKISARDKSLPDTPEVAETEDKRLCEVNEEELCSSLEESLTREKKSGESSDAMIDKIDAKEKLPGISGEIDDNRLSEDNEEKLCSSLERSSRAEKLGESAMINGSDANDQLSSEFPEVIDDNRLDEDNEGGLYFPLQKSSREEKFGQRIDAIIDEIDENDKSLPKISKEIEDNQLSEDNGGELCSSLAESSRKEKFGESSDGMVEQTDANDKSLPGIPEEIDDNRLSEDNEGKSCSSLEKSSTQEEKSGESFDAMIDGIDANDKLSSKIPEEIDDNRLSEVNEGKLCSSFEKSSREEKLRESFDAMIGGINVEEKSLKSEKEASFIEKPPEVLQEIEDDPSSEGNKEELRSSNEESPQKKKIAGIPDSKFGGIDESPNFGNEELADEVLQEQPDEFPERIGDNQLSKSDRGESCSSVVTSLSAVDKSATRTVHEKTESVEANDDLSTSFGNNDHSSLTKSEKTRIIESVKSKMNVARQLFSESQQIQGAMANGIEDSVSDERKESEELNRLEIPATETNEELPEEKFPEVSGDTKTSSDKMDTARLVPSNGNSLVPSSANSIEGDFSNEQKPSETSESLQLQMKTARMNLLGLSERVSMDSSFPGSSEPLKIPGKFETVEIQSRDQVPSKIDGRRKRKNKSEIEAIQPKPAKIQRRGKKKSDINSAAEQEIITTPLRSSRRRSKPKIFEDCVSPFTNRRTSTESKRKLKNQQEQMKRSHTDDKVGTNTLLPFDNFPAISEDSESPKKLIIDESKFGNDGESNFRDFRQIINEEKTEEFIKPSSSLKKLRKIGRPKKLKGSDSDVNVDHGTEITSVDSGKLDNQEEIGEKNLPEISATSGLPKNEKRRKSTKRKGPRVSRQKSKISRKSEESLGVAEGMIESPKIIENPPEIPEEVLQNCESSRILQEPEITGFASSTIVPSTPTTPEIPQLSANHEERLEENPVETPPELSPQCNTITREDLKIPETSPLVPDSSAPETPRSIAPSPGLRKTRGRRGRSRNQPLITRFLDPASESLESSQALQESDQPPVEAEIPSKPRGRKRKLKEQPLEAADEAQVPEEPNDAVDEEEISRSRSRRTTIKSDETDGEGLSESDDNESELTEETSTKTRRRTSGIRGRRKGARSAPRDNDYVPRVTKPCEKVPVKSKNEPTTVKCGKCQELMLSNVWARHSLTKHNNMAWLDGEEQPNYDDEKALKTLLVQTKKKKAFLVCESCGDGKRSVVGFISHIRFCGKTAMEKQSLMWTCPICTAILMPSSQEYHERQHRDDQTPRTVRNYADQERQMRKAAAKAVTKISEFTELVKDGEEPPTKKRKKITIHDFIQPPQMRKTIPGVWKGAWARSISNNEKAHCRQPGCTFSTDNLDEICLHYSTCNFTPRITFVCKICKMISPLQSEIEQHVRDEHADKFKDDDTDFEAHNSDDSDGQEGEGKLRGCIKPKPIIYSRAKFIDETFAYKKLKGDLTFIPSLKWTFDFELEHFSFHLFDELKPNVFTDLKNPESYLPQMKTSMSMSCQAMKKGVQMEWKKWKRFESQVINEVPAFYTGGPVWALAWLTLPAPLYDRELDQYVAVSTHSTMGLSYELGKSHKFRNSIQIWRIGHLNYDSKVLEDPQLSYIVGHDYGTIWCMEFCPSGAYDHEDLHAIDPEKKRMKRMGLLAAASSSGLVLIYSLPFPSELALPKDNCSSKLFKTEPVMILHVNALLQDEITDIGQCMKLSWSKTSNHDILVAGFSNGYVAVWDLLSKSPLLRNKINGTIHLSAYKHFYAHSHAVMFVDIVPVSEKRYLATAGMDRSTKTWDLEDTDAPVSVMKKGVAVNGVWMRHWPTSVTVYDDVLGLSHTQTYVSDLRGMTKVVIPLLPTNSTTFGIDKSDWSNAICHGTLAGEIVAAFPPQLLYLRDVDRLSRDRWLISNIELVDFGKKKKNEENEENDYNYMPESYEKCQKKFGIVYHDDLGNLRSNAWRKKNRKRGFLNSETMERVPVERYPFTSANRISWNTNAWSHLWLAVGYENGLVRILNLNKMSVGSIMDDMLSQHAKSMFKKAEQLGNS